MSLRVTTNGTMHRYKSNLMKAQRKLNAAGDTVLTNRKFNSFAEDPAAASRAFQLRRTYWKTENQITNTQTMVNLYDTAWSTIDSVVNDLGNDLAKASTLAGINAPTASGRQALGQVLNSTAEAIVNSMNVQYGDTYVFAGADGENAPFSWDANKGLLYRGISVNAEEGTDEYEKLKQMAGEKNFVDLGLGLQYDNDGKLVESSAFNSTISGLEILGFGVDADGDSKNAVSIIQELGKIFSACDPDTGDYANADDADNADRLLGKLKNSISNMTVEYTKIDTKASFLNTNLTRLENANETLNEQIVSVEDIDPAEAISMLTWAQYCYNAALQIGTSILSQSLLDYLN